MTKTETAITRFFDLYTRQSAQDDMAGLASHFADPFISAGPSGTQSVRVADFATALPRRKALFDRLRSQPTSLESLKETPLDSRYVLVRTSWRLSFIRDNAPAQEFMVDSTFLVDTGEPQTDPAEFKILLYLTHQDLMQILRDRGILQN